MAKRVFKVDFSFDWRGYGNSNIVEATSEEDAKRKFKRYIIRIVSGVVDSARVFDLGDP